MRKNLLDQLPLTPAPIAHAQAAEIIAMGDALERLPQAAAKVHEDLCWRANRKIDPSKGRNGMSAEQVLRAGLLKQLTGVSYEGLAFTLADSNTYRAFCRIGLGDQAPTRTTLQKNIKRVTAETWEAIQKMIVTLAYGLGIEDGKKMRSDCTVVESNIHHPTDSNLLGDCVRVLVRLMENARRTFGIAFNSRKRRAKRRVLGISNAKSMRERMPLYRDLVKIAEEMAQQATEVAEKLQNVSCNSIGDIGAAQGIGEQLRHFVLLTNNVLQQTERRVFRGESVPASEKVVSIFEPHTDIIIKGGRETEYGHKVCLTTGVSSLVTDIVVESGNPADCTLATKMVERHAALFGAPPLQAAFDGGFATHDNLVAIKAAGVQDAVFHKRCGIEIEDMARSTRVYKKLRAFRAGIEGTISFLKRVFGLARCTWSGFPSFRAYVHASAAACNLLVVARYLIAAQT